MVDFSGGSLTDARMRGRVLDVLANLEHGDWHEATIHTFSVNRTVERKGYRSEQPYHYSGPYQAEPRTLIHIEVEFDDNVTPGFKSMVGNTMDIEADRARADKQERLDKAAAELKAAQAKYDEAKAALQ